MTRARALSACALLYLLALSACAAPVPPPAAPPMPPRARITQPPAARAFAFEGAMSQGGAVIGTAPEGTARLQLDGRDIPLAPDGRFLIAFDRDAGPSARLTAFFSDGGTLAEELKVAPRQWRLEYVNAPYEAGYASETFRQLRPAELARIEAARSVRTGAQGWRQHFIWPRRGRVTGLFGAQRVYQGKPGPYHGGVDVAGAVGDPVVAPADGVVILAADHPFTLEGYLLMIDHGMGLNSAFLHLSRIDVKEGEPVRQGQVIGAVGATGRATGPHLHWGLKWNDARIDPMLLAGPIGE